jgi:hypothetical protein
LALFADRAAGPIRIIEFADYSCPACRALHPAWVAFARANPDVRISVTEYSIYGRTLVSRATGNRTLNASRIAIAAAAQGKQLVFHDALMGIPGPVDDRAIRLAAERAGLDLAAATRRAETPAIVARADANLRIAEELGFIGTPHVVVDGVLLSLQRGWSMQQVDCLVRAARTNRCPRMERLRTLGATTGRRTMMRMAVCCSVLTGAYALANAGVPWNERGFIPHLARFHAGGEEHFDRALANFQKAIELDPDYASAYGMAAWSMFWQRLNGWSKNLEADSAEGARLARAAVDLGKSDAVALTRGGHALAHFTRDLDAGIDFLDRAIVVNPNLASAWFLGAFLRIWRGAPEEAIKRFEHAMRLSPLDTELFRMQMGVGMAHLMARRFDLARAWAEKSFREAPIFPVSAVVIAASSAQMGDLYEARRAIANVRRHHPTLRASALSEWLPFRRPEDVALLSEGLKLAGLPD